MTGTSTHSYINEIMTDTYPHISINVFVTRRYFTTLEHKII